MTREMFSILALIGFALVCFFFFDSLFIEIGAAIVLTLVAVLLPISLVFRGKKGPR